MTWNDLSSTTQTLGIATALGYFIYRSIAGWYNTSMCLSIITERFQNRVKGSSVDILLINLNLEHGEHGALFLLALEARVTFDNQAHDKSPTSKIVHFVGTERVGLSMERKHLLDYMKTNSVNWDAKPSLPYRLSPKEKTRFDCSLLVPKDSVCSIEVVLLGRKPLSRSVAQWRISAISIPLATVESSTKPQTVKT